MPTNKTCSVCDTKLEKPGAVLLSPPIKANKEMSVTTVQKYHICITCWPKLVRAMNHLNDPKKD